MSNPSFFQTRMGRKFFEADVPRLIAVLERIADALEADKTKENEETKDG